MILNNKTVPVPRGVIRLKRRSDMTGKINTADLLITQEQLDRYHAGEGAVQIIFPTLSSEEREFIKSGITPDEWDCLRPPDECRICGAVTKTMNFELCPTCQKLEAK